MSVVSLFTLTLVDQCLNSPVKENFQNDNSKFHNVSFSYQIQTCIKGKFPLSNIWFISFVVSIERAMYMSDSSFTCFKIMSLFPSISQRRPVCFLCSFCFHYEFMHISIFNVVHSIAFTVINVRIVSSLGDGNLFKMTLKYFLIPCFISNVTKCSRSISCSRLGITYFSKKPKFSSPSPFNF